MVMGANLQLIERLFFEHEIEILVDDDMLFVPAEIMEDLEEDKVVVRGADDKRFLRIGRHRLRLGPYDVEADAYPIMVPNHPLSPGARKNRKKQGS